MRAKNLLGVHATAFADRAPSDRKFEQSPITCTKCKSDRSYNSCFPVHFKNKKYPGVIVYFKVRIEYVGHHGVINSGFRS